MFRIWQVLNIIFTIIVIIVNGLANALPLNGQTTGEVSDRFDVLFVPAGYVFSIWGLIYLGLIGFSIYQALPAQRNNALIRNISPYYWLSCAANIAWIFLWHYELFIYTIAAMMVLLFGLLMIYNKMDKRNDQVKFTEQLMVNSPFSLYLGWVSVATIANASQLLVYLGWGGWGISPTWWTVIMLMVTLLLGFLMLRRYEDMIYALVLIWALIGIAVKQNNNVFVSTAAWLITGSLVILLLFHFWKGREKA